MWDAFEEIPKPKYGVFENGVQVHTDSDICDALDYAKTLALDDAEGNYDSIIEYEDDMTFECPNGTVIRVVELR